MLPKSQGLKGRCYRSIAQAAGATWLLLTVGLLVLAHSESDAMFDRALREVAETILSFSDHELAEIHAEGKPAVEEGTEGKESAPFIYQVWKADGSLAYRSALAPEKPLTQGQSGYGMTKVGDKDFRSYAAWNQEHTFQIRIAASPNEQDNYFLQLSVGISLALLFTFLSFMGIVKRQLNRSFAPLETTAKLLASKSPDDLSVLETPTELPEIAPVIEAFNSLMVRVEHSMRQERRFANDAAHALRTPLSSLKILMGNVQRATEPSVRNEAFGMIETVVERSSLLVNQLLLLARFDRDPGAVDLSEMIDLVTLAQEVAAEFAPIAEERGVFIRALGVTQGIRVCGNRTALLMAVRSLVENAVSFITPAGTVIVEVMRDRESNAAMLRVHDDGPGVGRDLETRVFSLFFKGDRSDSPNAGLGLPLVSRIAKIHNGVAYLGVSTLLGGAMAVIRLSCAAAKADALPTATAS